MKHQTLLSLILLFLASALSAQAADLDSVKESMKQRLPAMTQLWSEDLIGENNTGFVEARGSLSPEQQKLVDAENADRTVVYNAIARNTQTTPEQVGKQRAAQISLRAAKGLWLQDAEGVWYKK